MSRLFFVAATIYVIATVSAGAASLALTIWAYNSDGRMLSDLVTAAIINTAAAVAAMGFFGGFDMIFTIWQFLRNQEAEKARNQEREEERKVREEERKVREEERRVREEERKVRDEDRKAQQAEREEIMAMLRAEHERSAELTARVMELSEIVVKRANGHDANGNGENNRGE